MHYNKSPQDLTILKITGMGFLKEPRCNMPSSQSLYLMVLIMGAADPSLTKLLAPTVFLPYGYTSVIKAYNFFAHLVGQRVYSIIKG